MSRAAATTAPASSPPGLPPGATAGIEKSGEVTRLLQAAAIRRDKRVIARFRRVSRLRTCRVTVRHFALAWPTTAATIESMDTRPAFADHLQWPPDRGICVCRVRAVTDELEHGEAQGLGPPDQRLLPEILERGRRDFGGGVRVHGPMGDQQRAHRRRKRRAPAPTTLPHPACRRQWCCMRRGPPSQH